jgi:hypothetical protein
VKLKLALFMSFSLAVAGCQTVQSNVTRFSNLPDPTPRTFAFAPEISQSLEATTYAALIAQELQKHGWSRVDGPAAQTVISFRYGIDGGQTVSSSIPIYGQTGGGTTFSSGTIQGTSGSATYRGTSYSPPTFGVVGEIDVDDEVFTRQFSLSIVDQKSRAPVFEANVRSRGSTGNFAAVAPCLVRAMFKTFPGQNGVSERVTLPSSECIRET